MKVVLLENLKNIGKKGDIKEVKDGYAMNFLIPQKKAKLATPNNIKQAENLKKKEEEIKKEIIIESEKEAKTVKGKRITVEAKAQGEKLFGSLSNKKIIEILKNNNISLKNGKLSLEKVIKTTGEHKIQVVWPENIQESFTLIIEAIK